MANKEYLTTAEVARALGVSRVTVFNRIKRGNILATRHDRSLLVTREELARLLDKDTISKEVVKKVVEEYGETLKLLGRE